MIKHSLNYDYQLINKTNSASIFAVTHFYRSVFNTIHKRNVVKKYVGDTKHNFLFWPVKNKYAWQEDPLATLASKSKS